MPVAIRTDVFGTLRGTIDAAGVRHRRRGGDRLELRAAPPGSAQRRGRRPPRRAEPPRRASVLAADGVAAGSATRARGRPARRRYADRLERPSVRAAAVRRARGGAHARRTGRPGAAPRSSPALQRAAAAALGDKLGGIAVIRPRDGAVLALAASRLRAPATRLDVQDHHDRRGAPAPRRDAVDDVSRPHRRDAVGRRARATPAARRAAGRCELVRAVLQLRVRAARARSSAPAGSWPPPRRSGSTSSRGSRTRSRARSRRRDLKDDLAVGAAAIGQDRDLATPLGMAERGRDDRRPAAAAPAADHDAAERSSGAGARVRTRRPPGAGDDDRRRPLRHRHGGGAPGRHRGGQDRYRRARRPNSTEPEDADAWFVAFAPAERPRVAVAVMLVGAGFGGTAAAPIARQVLSAAL